MTNKMQIETMAVGVRDLAKDEYYVVYYKRVSGDFAYRCFRSKRAAGKFAVEALSRVRIANDGREIA